MNYQLVLEEELKKIKPGSKLLLHACCAPCSSYCIEYLSNYFEIIIYYYNPNIDTDEEYNKRVNELKRFIKEFKTKYPVHLIDTGHLQEEYMKEIIGLENEPERGARCLKCYELRLRKSFEYAKEHNFDYITTTLTLSPLKNSKVINEIGKKLEDEFNFKYLYSDFKKKEGYKRSIILSREYNLYRQDYCGCKFSKKNKISD
ncbi:MAG: epoxyqueuosine reductase QueH [Bacilli bacterium]|nr:epoxyqueuosine reductase QueH [Bacilli bacterium]